MESVSQEHLLPQVEQAVWTILQRCAGELARSSGFIQRQGQKITGANFAQTLILGLLQDPKASLDALVQFGADVGLDITAQGLDQRFTKRAAKFLQALFEVALAQVILADPVAIPLLERFAAVYLEDSTQVRLPDGLAELFRGSGGHHGGKGTKAAFKLQARLEMVRGQLSCSSLLDGRQADSKTPLQHESSPARSLHIRDRGFVDLKRWQAEARQGQYMLSYYKNTVGLFDQQGQAIDLPLWLAQAPQRGEIEVLVGSQERLPMRLFFERVPAEVARERRRYLRREAQTHERASSHEAELLAGWTLALTNVPPELLSWTQALVLLRLRWQIELLFKLWKEQGLLDEWRTHKPDRILCEVYAKLIGLLIQHWLLIIGCWQEPHRSLVKAAKAVRSHAILLAVALSGDLDMRVALRRTQRATRAGSRMNSRADAPNTSQLLLAGCNTWSSQPLKEKKRR